MVPSSAERAAVVVGVHRAETSEPAVRWAAAEARRRGLPLRLVHAWRDDVTVEVALAGEDLPDLDGPAVSSAEPGRAAAVLLAQPAALLVLGAHAGSPHLRRVTRLCLHRAGSPVVVVPEEEAPNESCVVVGIDVEAPAREALRWAVQAAAWRHADLAVVHAWTAHAHGAADVLHLSRVRAAQRERAAGLLEDLVAAEASALPVAESVLVHGAPLDVLLEQSGQAGLVVVGRRTHHGWGRLLNGAVADSLAALAPCPVAVVPS